MRDQVTETGIVLVDGIGVYQLSDQGGGIVELTMTDVRELHGWFGDLLSRPTPETPAARPGGLDCGVDLRTGKGVCVCGRCSTANR